MNQEYLEEYLSGPLCIYWYEEDAIICGHRSCYQIIQDGDLNESEWRF